MTAAIADLKVTVSGLEDRMEAGFADVRAEMRAGFTEVRTEMHTQFRWLMGGIGTAALAILVAVLAAILTRG